MIQAALDSLCTYTLEGFIDEAAACSAFDADVAGCDLFRILDEVEGEYVQPRHGADLKSARIDRLLIPTVAAHRAGWRSGVIGVEIKRSGTKLGKVVAQCMDYTRVAWVSPQLGTRLLCNWIFIWPAPKVEGDLASIMAQNRIGIARPAHGCSGIQFYANQRSTLTFNKGRATVVLNPVSGAKTGSR